MSSKTLRSYFEVTKPRTVWLLVYVAAAAGIAAYFTVEPQDNLLRNLLLLVAAVTIGSMGTNAITSYIDRRMDALMERTRHRPIPTERVTPPRRALWYGVVLMVIALFMTLLINLWAAFWYAVGVLDVAVVYNGFLKRRHPINVIAGSFGGGAPVMGAWSAMSGEAIALTPVLMAALVVLWIPIHIWSLAIRYREDYARVGVPMLPVVLGERAAIRCVASTSILLVIFSTALAFLMDFTIVLTSILLIGNAAILLLSIWLLARPSGVVAWRLFKVTSPYLAAMFTLFMVGGYLKLYP